MSGIQIYRKIIHIRTWLNTNIKKLSILGMTDIKIYWNITPNPQTHTRFAHFASTDAGWDPRPRAVTVRVWGCAAAGRAGRRYACAVDTLFFLLVLSGQKRWFLSRWYACAVDTLGGLKKSEEVVPVQMICMCCGYPLLSSRAVWRFKGIRRASFLNRLGFRGIREASFLSRWYACAGDTLFCRLVLYGVWRNQEVKFSEFENVS